MIDNVPEARLHPFQSCAAEERVGVAKLYRWNSEVSLALFDDISVIEVSMRSAMARELQSAYGDEWFRNATLFDDDTLGLISRAWDQGRLKLLNAPPDEVHGKLVASFSFGFWVKLLGRGSHGGLKGPMGRAPFVSSNTRRIYDQLLWYPALHNAFRGITARQRERVESAARDIQLMRNRVAHHESVIWGIPPYGQKNKDGTARNRITLAEAQDTILKLAGYIDPELGNWYRDNSALSLSVRNRPVTRNIDYEI